MRKLKKAFVDAFESGIQFGGAVKDFLDMLKIVLAWPIPFLCLLHVQWMSHFGPVLLVIVLWCLWC